MSGTARTSPLTILIAANGPLWDASPEAIGGRSARTIPVRSPLTPLAGVATTIVTGVSPLMHDIVTDLVPGRDGDLVPPTAAHRRFPAFWSEADLARATVTIDWPATDEDPDLPSENRLTTSGAAPGERSLAGIQMMAEAAARADVRVVALALAGLDPDARHTQDPAPLAAAIDAVFASTPPDTVGLILHRGSRARQHVLLVVGGAEGESPATARTTLSSVGGNVRRLVGSTLPLGCGVGPLPGLDLPPVDAASRPIARLSAGQTLQWPEAPDAPDAALLRGVQIRRLTCLSRYAFIRRDWERLASIAEDLASVRGDQPECWMALLAAFQQGDQGDVPTAADRCTTRFPDTPLAYLAAAMLAAPTDPEAAARSLESIDPEDLPFDTMPGPFGRLCLRVGRAEVGRAALERAMQTGSATAADRLALARHLLLAGQPQDARAALGGVGGPGGPKAWALLRLKILKACGDRQAADTLSRALLRQHPADADVRAAAGQ
ncbi:MAG: hypothetical protein QF733_09220 [Phycisphaerales bacterium]|jgi:hypothetical protein|nr:hypothetical protein [Phycisphaerales bacterium]